MSVIILCELVMDSELEGLRHGVHVGEISGHVVVKCARFVRCYCMG
jgi:hypothetical protein